MVLGQENMRMGIRKVSGKLRLIESRRRRKFLWKLNFTWDKKKMRATLCFNAKKPFLFSLSKLIWESEWDRRPSFVSAVIGSKCLKLSPVYDLLPHPNLSNLPTHTTIFWYIFNHILVIQESSKIPEQPGNNIESLPVVHWWWWLMMPICIRCMFAWCGVVSIG